MNTNDRKVEIDQKVNQINSASEKYQLIHAMFAIENIFQSKMQQNYKEKFDELRNQMKHESDPDKLQDLFNEAKELQKESSHRIRIIVEYLSQIKPGNARISRTENNNFRIALPKEMETIRKSDGTIDFDLLKDLRKLMAHELGHVVLHSNILDESGKPYENPDLGPEDEADYFADRLIELRKTHNEEIHKKI